MAAFIGSPAMNLGQTSVGSSSIGLGSYTIPLDREHRPRFATPGSAIVGVRPEFEHSEFAPSGLPQIEVRVEVLEELGSDAYVFFEVDTEPIVVEEAVSVDGDEDGQLLAERKRALFAARVDARTRAKVGDTIRLTVDPSRLYFFSPETGESLLSHAA